MKNNKGFTLIELLAVIIILAILMLVAIPSVTSYISNSRKKGYVITANEYIKAVTNEANSAVHDLFDPDVTYYFPVKCIPLESGGDSPYGKFKDAYVIVTYDNESFDYYFASVDETGIGMDITAQNDLDEKRIKAGLSEFTPDKAIGGRYKVKVMNPDTCTFDSEATEVANIFGELNVIDDVEKYTVNFNQRFARSDISEDFEFYLLDDETRQMVSEGTFKTHYQIDNFTNALYGSIEYQNNQGYRKARFYYTIPEVIDNTTHQPVKVNSIYYYLTYDITDIDGIKYMRYLCKSKKSEKGDNECSVYTNTKFNYVPYVEDNIKLQRNNYKSINYIVLANGDTIDFVKYWNAKKLFKNRVQTLGYTGDYSTSYNTMILSMAMYK